MREGSCAETQLVHPISIHIYLYTIIVLAAHILRHDTKIIITIIQSSQRRVPKYLHKIKFTKILWCSLSLN